MKTRFVGRTAELDRLNRAWQGGGAELVVVSGRRRVGKTALLAQWMRQSESRTLYWCASSNSALALLRGFSRAIYTFAFPGVPVPPDFTFPTWEAAWQQIAALTQPGRLGVILDDFPALLAADPTQAERLRHLWKTGLRSASLVVILSGTALGAMKRACMNDDATLQAEITARIDLKELPFSCLVSYFPNFSTAEQVTIYSLFGGIPAYWEYFDRERSLAHNLKTLLSSYEFTQAEPRLLLDDVVSEAHNYAAILTALAHGARAPREVAAYTGLPNMHMPKYLGVLAEAGWIERRVPVNEREPSRAGQHVITDPFLHFIFRFLAHRQTQLALGKQDQVAAEIMMELPGYVAATGWEALCQGWLQDQYRTGLQQVGSAVRGTIRAGVAGIHWDEKRLVLGTCLWGNNPGGAAALIELAQVKAPALLAGLPGSWQVELVGFSRSGWTDEARAFRRGGEAVRLVGLDEVIENAIMAA